MVACCGIHKGYSVVLVFNASIKAFKYTNDFVCAL